MAWLVNLYHAVRLRGAVGSENNAWRFKVVELFAIGAYIFWAHARICASGVQFDVLIGECGEGCSSRANLRGAISTLILFDG